VVVVAAGYKQQIPFGDDKKKSDGNRRDPLGDDRKKSSGNSRDPSGMTERKATATADPLRG
jgi:hypothetical protein